MERVLCMGEEKENRCLKSFNTIAGFTIILCCIRGCLFVCFRLGLGLLSRFGLGLSGG